MKQQIACLFDEYFTNRLFSGAGLVSSKDGIIFSGAYGFAHRGFKIPNTIDTRFDTASVTKLFTAVAILQLVDGGILKLDDRITDIIDLGGTKIPRDVTFSHLLTHTSGIADDADEEAGEKYEDLFIRKPNYSIRENSDFIPQFAYKEPLFKAGTAVRYNNCAFVLLGLALEKTTGRSYRDYVENEIFGKCGMNSTSFRSKDDADAEIAEGYLISGFDADSRPCWRKNIYSFPPVGTADSGAYTTVWNFDIFMRSLKAETLLSKNMTAELFKPQVRLFRETGSGIVRNGYGFHFLYSNEGQLKRMFKEGENAGVAAMLAYYPDIDTTSILLANQTCDIWTLHHRIEEIILGGV